ncbi:hypothetical protein ACFVOR_14690 [Streptomyces sp. NPDC057837]|uniref:hypothetical protein n=1 Tax=Streptomyces sp. NPDC057837 TaxID=3346260 RepID=UPI00369E9B22
MGAQPSPGGDELRARHYLRRLGARPLGHQEPPMPHDDRRRPVTPTRVIPGGAALPARPPEPGEAPPWRTPPPPPPPTVAAPLPVPPDPEPRIVEVRHVHQVVLTSPEPAPKPDPRLWERLWERLFTWRMVVAILAAVVPWVNGQSPVGLWSHTVHLARTEAGILAAYAIAGVAVGAAWVLDHRSSPPGQPSRALPRFLLVTASLGAFGVLHWWDPILALTGVDL